MGTSSKVVSLLRAQSEDMYSRKERSKGIYPSFLPDDKETAVFIQGQELLSKADNQKRREDIRFTQRHKNSADGRTHGIHYRTDKLLV